MKKSVKRLMWAGYLAVLAISTTGVCLAYIGMLVKQDAVYWVGLILALPLLVIVLPICVLLIAMFPIAGVYAALRWTYGRMFGGGPGKEAKGPPTTEVGPKRGRMSGVDARNKLHS
jgi:hypothetical protein